MPGSISRKPDFKVAFFSFLAAATFWLMNALNKDGYTTKLDYPLDIKYNDTLYIPTTPLPKQISVNVSGNGWTLFKRQWSLNTLPLEYEILQPLKAKFINTSALTDMVAEQVKDLKINYVVTDTLEIDFDKKISKKIRIEVDSLGINLRKPYVVSSLINITPRTILATGPESLIKSLDNTFTIAIPIKKIDSDFDNDIPLEFPQNTNLSFSHSKVQVSFEVATLQIPIEDLPKPTPKVVKEPKKAKKKSKK